MEHANGSKWWYTNGKEVSHSDWITEFRKKKLAFL